MSETLIYWTIIKDRGLIFVMDIPINIEHLVARNCVRPLLCDLDENH